MTAQIAEKLIYDGDNYAMCTEPLGKFFAMGGTNPGFMSNSTALWRGYVGDWEIAADRLYLVGLNGTLKDGSDASLETVFSGFPDRVFAHWYSGTVRIPQGKLLDYVHMAYASQYERDLLLTFEKGVLVRTEVRENGESDSNTAPEGYGIGGMTVFPVGPETDDSE